MKENFERSGGLAEFREKIKEFADMERSGESKTGHFISEGATFNPEALTDEDLNIWRKIEDETITLDDFHEYQGQVIAELMAEGTSEEDLPNSPRMIFAAFVANKAMPIVNKAVMEALKK